MAQLIVNAMCSGTETKHSSNSGKDYQITTFVEMPSMKSFQLFGDFQLPLSQEVKQYIFETGVDASGKLSFPKLVSSLPVPAPVKK